MKDIGTCKECRWCYIDHQWCEGSKVVEIHACEKKIIEEYVDVYASSMSPSVSLTFGCIHWEAKDDRP